MQVRILVLLLVFLASAPALPSRQDDAALRDSLSRVHPRMRASWLKERGIRDEYWHGCVIPQDSGLRCIGRWSFGPSYDVDGCATPTDTLVALARGSGVSLLRFSRTDTVELEMLSDVNAGGLMKRVVVRDSLLYIGSTAGLEIWDIADVHSPTRLSWTPIPLNDFCVQESLAYVIGADDSFRVYNVANPADPAFRGASRDSGSTVAVAGGVALVGDRWGLYVLDVGDPANPHRVSSWGSAIKGATARGNLAFVSTYDPNDPGWLRLTILDVSDPGNVRQLGYLQDAGGLDLHLIDTLAICSGDQYDNELRIVSVADSTAPRLIGTGVTTGWNWGVWASGLARSAFVADVFDGVQVFDIGSTASPIRDTAVLAAHRSLDVAVDGDRAYVASELSGLHVLDICDPSRPSTLGALDVAGGSYPVTRSVVAKDSFAFVGWTPRPQFRSVDVSDPTRPALAGGYDVLNWPEDMVLRDSLCYLAEHRRLQIVNAAHPRSPILVGSCELPGTPGKLDLDDTTACAATYGVQCMNVADPSSPRIVGSYETRVSGLDVVDTVVYGAGPYTGLIALSIADLATPYLLDSLHLTDTLWWNDVCVAGSVAYVGGERVWAVDVSNPSDLRLIPGGTWTPPRTVARMVAAGQHIYAACQEGGISILETIQVGLSETDGREPHVLRSMTLYPNPAYRSVAVHAGPDPVELVLRDVAGRQRMTMKSRGTAFTLDLAGLRPGLYFVELRCGSGRRVEKLVKR